jgi:hypothetical protein
MRIGMLATTARASTNGSRSQKMTESTRSSSRVSAGGVSSAASPSSPSAARRGVRASPGFSRSLARKCGRRKAQLAQASDRTRHQLSFVSWRIRG